MVGLGFNSESKRSEEISANFQQNNERFGLWKRLWLR
jgi:hypothetical protein